MRKGVSPLISWILIIAMAISIGAIVYKWAVDFAKNVDLSEDDNIYCDNVDIKLIRACRDGSYLKINITNTGYFNISAITFTKATETTPIGSCLHFVEPALKPSSKYYYDFDLEKTYQNATELGICENSAKINTNVRVNEFNLVPWINLKGRDIACTERKIALSNIDINTVCSELLP